MPQPYSLQIYRGDTHGWQFALWTDVSGGTPYDLTNITVKAEIRDQPGGAIIVPLMMTVTLPNIITATLDAANSAMLPIPGVWDLQLTDTFGNVTTVIAGKVYVTPDVTDSTPPTATRRRMRLVA